MQLGKRAQSSPPIPRNGGEPAPFSSAAMGRTVPIHINSRRPVNVAELQDEIAGMAASLAEVDARASERLSDLASAVGTDEGRLRWADVDLRRAFNTEHMARAYALKREGVKPKSVDKADKIRNVLVLMPILLTWFALAEATRAYQRFIETHPDEVRKPFLLLWQQGFGGELNRWSASFSTVALIDAVIIFIIILLTFYSHGRREEHEENIFESAESFQADLDNALAEATVALAPDRAGRPAMLARSVDRLADRFEYNSQELLTRLKVEHDRLEAIAARREKEFSDFGVFASGMRAGAEETHRLLLDLRQVSTGLQHALEDLTNEVGVSADQQRSLFTAVTSLERLVATGIQSDHGVTRQLSDAAQALADAADKSLAGSEAAAQAGRVATEAVRGIAEISATLAASQTRLESAMTNETDVNSRLAEALRSGMNGVGATAQTLTEIMHGLTSLKDEFNHIAELGREQSITLSRLLTEQSAVSGGLAQIARDVSGGGSRSREGTEELSALVRRLEALTPAPVPAAPAGAARTGGLPPAPDLLSDPDESPSSRARGLWPRRD